jgi:hypothetical protein
MVSFHERSNGRDLSGTLSGNMSASADSVACLQTLDAVSALTRTQMITISAVSLPQTVAEEDKMNYFLK